MNPKSIRRLGSALASLDFTAENARIQALQNDVTECEAAIGRAEARRSELSIALQGNLRPAGSTVADALLANDGSAELIVGTASREAMEAERASLGDGTRELGHRARDTREEIKSVEHEAMHKVSLVVRPLVDEIVAHARDAAASLAQSYAALIAIVDAAKVGSIEANMLREAVAGFIGTGSILPNGRIQQIPEELVTVLRSLADRGPALRDARFRSSVEMP